MVCIAGIEHTSIVNRFMILKIIEIWPSVSTTHVEAATIKKRTSIRKANSETGWSALLANNPSLFQHRFTTA